MASAACVPARDLVLPSPSTSCRRGPSTP
uniref:Uncharacterized protein n=1 Tax=Arundo donax TaxID=35708 RepID=A0A0A9B1K4_ARUDO